MNYSTILFDLDGTLTDPKVGITNAVQYALRHFGIDVEDLDLLEPFIGPPLADSFQKFYGLNESESMEAILVYREYFSDRGLFENQVYPGIPELLTRLQAAGHTLIVATSKPTEFAERILARFNLAQYFSFVGGSTFDGSRSLKADVIAHVRKEYGFDPASTIMIGDRKHDLIGAKEEGLPAIGVSYGYGSIAELENENPIAIVNTPEELENFLLPQ